MIIEGTNNHYKMSIIYANLIMYVVNDRNRPAKPTIDKMKNSVHENNVSGAFFRFSQKA